VRSAGGMGVVLGSFSEVVVVVGGSKGGGRWLCWCCRCISEQEKKREIHVKRARDE